MNSIVNLWANTSGIWKKVAAFLPLLIAVGTLLSGGAGLCLEFGHAANTSAMLDLLKNIQSDPNLGLVVAGLGALGIHFNHSTTVATLADHEDKIQSANPPPSGT